MRQARHNTTGDRVADGTHDNGDRCGSLLRGKRGIGTPGEDDIYFEADQIVRQLGESFKILLDTCGLSGLQAECEVGLD